MTEKKKTSNENIAGNGRIKKKKENKRTVRIKNFEQNFKKPFVKDPVARS